GPGERGGPGGQAARDGPGVGPVDGGGRAERRGADEGAAAPVLAPGDAAGGGGEGECGAAADGGVPPGSAGLLREEARAVGTGGLTWTRWTPCARATRPWWRATSSCAATSSTRCSPASRRTSSSATWSSRRSGCTRRSPA